MKITYCFYYWFKEYREVKWEYEPTFDYKSVYAFLYDKYSLEEIKAELDGTGTGTAATKAAATATAAADNADDDIEDDDIMFGADDIDGVSKANKDDLGDDNIDSIMSSWL